jgi:[protein-PII] uridylyltransferase
VSEDINTKLSKQIRQKVNIYKDQLLPNIKSNDGISFCIKHCKYIDAIITNIFTSIIKNTFKEYYINNNHIPISIFALGSYARMQMSVYSDIDLMILYEDIDGFNSKKIIEDILHILWDSRLDISHRVHTLAEIQDIIKDDDTIQTAIFEARFITGSKILHTRFKENINYITSIYQQDFIKNKLKEYNTIDKNKNFCMQFDIKKSIGTIRDINMLMWIAKHTSNIYTIKELYTNNICNYSEYIKFKKALSLILSLRANLHILSNKKQNMIFLEILPDLAQNIKTSLPQITLNKQILNARVYIYKYCNIYISKISQEYINTKNQKYITKNIFCIKNTIYTRWDNTNYKQILIDMLNMIDKPYVFDGSILYAIDNINEIEFKDIFTPQIIQELFNKRHLYNILRVFYNTQKIQYIFKAFKNILYLGQFDSFHLYPVGFHLLQVVYHLENIQDTEILTIYNNLNNIDKNILKFIALFHDIGKGRVIDHSIIGADIFAKYAKIYGYRKEDIQKGKILITYHILMSKKAYTEDIYNEQNIIDFCSSLYNKNLIDMLYILTYIDHLGSNPSSLTSHKRYLLKEFYNISINYLGDKDILKSGFRKNKMIESLKRDVSFRKIEYKQQQKILNISSNLFFIKYSKKDILQIAQKSFDIKDFVFEVKNDNFLSIEIIRKTPLNLGYLLQKLSFLDLVHLDIFKIFDDIKYFKINFSQKVDDDIISTIKYDISKSFDMSKKVNLSHISIDEKNISLDDKHSISLAKMIIKGKNQKGLFAFISRVFDQENIDIQSAKIHTSKNKIQDMLLIEKNDFYYTKIKYVMNILSK